MSVTVDFASVAGAIDSLSISGVTIKDIDEVVANVGMGTPCLMPIPDNYITEVVIEYDELTQQKQRLAYTMNYRYYHCQIADGLGGLFAMYSGLITNLAAILLAFTNDATLTGATNNTNPIVTNIGPVYDPAGNAYHGFDISIRIMRMLEV